MGSKTTRLHNSVVVIGLGRFGRSLAREVMAGGAEVLAIDADDHVVQSLTGRLTHVVTADSTDEEALRQLSVHEFRRAVVAIGTDVESSILTTSILVDFGIPNIWAKAISNAHAKILSKVGAHHVVRPEHDMGRRVAHLVGGKLQDYIEFDDEGYAIAKTTPPSYLWGLPLRQSTPRTKHGAAVIGVKSPGQGFILATPDTVINRGDTIIVSGQREAVERFSNMD
ncbi:potassium channel family protein [Nocardioides sp. NPDC057772]|uniref:potassium channel family protein n=1 Tax=Nocardioides sp. NPDC057772 TaxID=3346245 RepID=UPI00366BDB66